MALPMPWPLVFGQELRGRPAVRGDGRDEHQRAAFGDGALAPRDRHGAHRGHLVPGRHRLGGRRPLAGAPAPRLMGPAFHRPRDRVPLVGRRRDPAVERGPGIAGARARDHQPIGSPVDHARVLRRPVSGPVGPERETSDRNPRVGRPGRRFRGRHYGKRLRTAGHKREVGGRQAGEIRAGH